MIRYSVREVEGFDSGDSRVRVFNVDWPCVIHGRQQTDSTDVWVSGERVNCASCSGPLTAMSASCAHVKAVKYRLAKEATSRVT